MEKIVITGGRTEKQEAIKEALNRACEIIIETWQELSKRFEELQEALEKAFEQLEQKEEFCELCEKHRETARSEETSCSSIKAIKKGGRIKIRSPPEERVRT